jgi:hypothetical protein
MGRKEGTLIKEIASPDKKIFENYFFYVRGWFSKIFTTYLFELLQQWF